MPSNNEPTFEQLLAWSMDAEPELLPHLPALFEDLNELGARVVEVKRILAGHPLRERARVLDLGCGKGAVALALANEFGCVVDGVDGMAEFVRHVELRSSELSLQGVCRFSIADVRDVVVTAREYDLVCLLALGDVLGRLDQTVAALRQCVIPGGLILIDDAYLQDGVDQIEDVVNCYDHATTLALLQSHGDAILEELVVDGPESAAAYRAMTDAIVRRAEELAVRHPEAADALGEFAVRQRDEVDLLAGPVVGAVWLLQKAAE